MSHATLCFLSYQRPQFLKRAVSTALQYADEPVECIIHDDGSTDRELLKLLYTWHQKGVVSQVILNAPGINQGQGVALNRMFNAATGDLIIKLDQDLVFKPGWLRRTREILETDPRVALLGLFKYWLDPVDFRKTVISDAELLDRYGYRREILPRGHSYHTHICGSAMVIPRVVWDQLGPFPQRWESFGEDWEFQKRVHASEIGFNALPDDDLVENRGFGIGPSTVVVQGEDGPEPAKIHQLPLLIGGQA